LISKSDESVNSVILPRLMAMSCALTSFFSSDIVYCMVIYGLIGIH